MAADKLYNHIQSMFHFRVHVLQFNPMRINGLGYSYLTLSLTTSQYTQNCTSFNIGK